MLRSDTKQLRHLGYLERSSPALQCLDEFHRNTPFLADEGIGTPITLQARPCCSRCLILLCLGLIAHAYRGSQLGWSKDRPSLARPCQAEAFIAVAIRSGLNRATWPSVTLPRHQDEHCGSLDVFVQIERRPGLRFIAEVLAIHRFDPENDRYDPECVYLRLER
jgi:hypothetical protein